MTGIVTLTAAGAIDATYRVGALRRGTFTRAESYTREVSGKGVNVSAALAAGGADTAAVVVLGADDVRFASGGLTAPLLRIVEDTRLAPAKTPLLHAARAAPQGKATHQPLLPEDCDATLACLP